MKYAVFATAATLFVASSAAAANLSADTARASPAAMADYRTDGTPHILNDRPWAEICPGNRNLCDTTGSIKPVGRSS